MNRLNPLFCRPSKESISAGKPQKFLRPIRAEISPKMLSTWQRKRECTIISANARRKIDCQIRNPVNLRGISALSSFNLSGSLLICSSRCEPIFRKLQSGIAYNSFISELRFGNPFVGVKYPNLTLLILPHLRSASASFTSRSNLFRGPQFRGKSS